MITCETIDGPPYDYCSCGWPLLKDGTCSNGECPDGWDDPCELDDEEEPDE